jgi:hypothetical protein
MPGLVIDGKVEEIPGIRVLSWYDDPVLRLKMGEDMRQRYTRWIRGICLHTTKGIPGGKDLRPQKVLPGLGSHNSQGEKVAKFWATDGRQAGAHLVVDFDGEVSCCADLLTEAAYHAGEEIGRAHV